MSRLLSTAAVAIAVLLASVSNAGALTIGQRPPFVPAAECTSSPFDIVQATVTAGNSYVVPSVSGSTVWTVRSWGTDSAVGSGQMLTMKFFRKVAEPNTYEVVAHDGPQALPSNSANLFRTNLTVRSGDILGLNDVNASTVHNACSFPVPGETNRQRSGDLADFASADFPIASVGHRANVTAEIFPDNTFTLGAATRNKKKGTATGRVTVPNPGIISVIGQGVKSATIAVSVPPGTVNFPISAAAKSKKKLNSTGKAKVLVNVTYTPNAGVPSVQQTFKVKLKKKL